MPSILIAFATREGHTRDIATHVEKRLRAKGIETTLLDLTRDAALPDDAGFDGFILAGSLHNTLHEPELEAFAESHRTLLESGRSLMLSVSLSAASDKPEDIAGATESARSFIERTGWHPDQVHLVAGGVHLDRLNWLDRLMLRIVLATKGVELEPDGSKVLTDWEALDAVLERFVAKLGEPGPA